jgi:hypothetical protein
VGRYYCRWPPYEAFAVKCLSKQHQNVKTHQKIHFLLKLIKFIATCIPCVLLSFQNTFLLRMMTEAYETDEKLTGNFCSP